MKSHALLTLMFVICSTGSLMSMEQGKRGRLNFLLNHAWQIKGNSAQNMEYEVKPSDFLGKKITEAVPLDKDDKEAISKALNLAAESQETVAVAYGLNGIAFWATITPIVKANKKNNFFVKVTPFGDNCVKIDD
jgi:hypothetical protein